MLSVVHVVRLLRKLVTTLVWLLPILAVVAVAVLYILDPADVVGIVREVWANKKLVAESCVAAFIFLTTLALSIKAEDINERSTKLEHIADTLNTSADKALGAAKGASDTASEFQNVQTGVKESVNELGKAQNTLQTAVGDLGSTATAIEGMLGRIQERVEAGIYSHETTPGASDHSDRSSEDYWEDISSLWAEAKDFLELKVAEYADGDGRKIGRYSRIARHTYFSIADNLLRDKMISGSGRDAVYWMNKKFNEYRPQKWTVPKSDWEEFQRRLRVLKED